MHFIDPLLYINAMDALRLDRSSPTPLYHQIVQAIRWKIGTGALRTGEILPPVREAADRWAVNYHTVRRAYHELASEGWVESLQGLGTRVAAVPPVESSNEEGDLDHWLGQIIATGQDRYGLSPEDLAAVIRERARVLRVVMVECNVHQSGFLARQLEQAWGVEAIPWSLEAAEAPPQLPIIGTYFHHAEMRSRWPDRIGEMHFVALYLDPALKERVERVAARRGTRVLRLVEQDPATAREMAAGVSGLLSTRFEIEPVVGDPDEVLQSLAEDELLLVAPRLWNRLRAETQQDERVFDVRHVIVPEDMQRVWRSLARTAVETNK